MTELTLKIPRRILPLKNLKSSDPSYRQYAPSGRSLESSQQRFDFFAVLRLGVGYIRSGTLADKRLIICQDVTSKGKLAGHGELLAEVVLAKLGQ